MAALYCLASHTFETMVTPEHPQPSKILPRSAPRTALSATSAPSLRLLPTKTKNSPPVLYLVHDSLIGSCSFRHPLAAPFAAGLVSLAPGFAASWSSTAWLLLLLQGTFKHQHVVLCFEARERKIRAGDTGRGQAQPLTCLSTSAHRSTGHNPSSYQAPQALQKLWKKQLGLFITWEALDGQAHLLLLPGSWGSSLQHTGSADRCCAGAAGTRPAVQGGSKLKQAPRNESKAECGFTCSGQVPSQARYNRATATTA